MKKSLAAILFVGGLLSLGAAAQAADGCGPGCHATLSGACAVDGWGVLPPGTQNECPAGARATRPCPRGFAWKYGACFPN